MFLFATGSSHALGFEVLGFIAMALIAAVVGELFVRRGQPNIVGIMIVAIMFGNIFGLSSWASNPILLFLAEIGAVLILFYAGLESDLSELAGKFYSGLAVAMVGVVVPFGLVYFFLTYVYGLHWGVSLLTANVLVATSVAVTVSLFSQHGAQKSKLSDTILVAAVIDDILGMILLGIVEPFVGGQGEYSLRTTLKQIGFAVGFIIGGIIVGRFAAGCLSSVFTNLFHSGNKGALLLALLICTVFVVISSSVGLAPIIGAFTAGLILDHTHFGKFHKATTKVEELMKPLRNVTLPFFFFMAGISVNLNFLFGPQFPYWVDLYSLGLVLSLLTLATIGKLASGFVVTPHGSRFGLSNWVIGMAMNPRGEVGMVIALMGKQLGVFTDQTYGALVITIFLTTLLPPIALNSMIPRYMRAYYQ